MLSFIVLAKEKRPFGLLIICLVLAEAFDRAKLYYLLHCLGACACFYLADEAFAR
jgi:hypothetical protein